MNIASKAGDVETAYVSDSKPVPNSLPEGLVHYSFMGEVPERVISDISRFINDNNRNVDGNVVMLTPSMIVSLMSTGSYCVIVRDSNVGTEPVVGCIFTVPVSATFVGVPIVNVEEEGKVRSSPARENVRKTPTSAGYSDGKVHSSFTGYLCVKPSLRGKGVAMALIRLVMNVGYPHGVRSGYYMCRTPHHRCYCNLESWYRPLNAAKARAEGFPVTNVLPSKEKGKRVGSRCGSGLQKDWSFSRVCADKAEETARALSTWGHFNRRVCWSPSDEEFCQFVRFNKVFRILRRDKLVAVAVLFDFPILVKSNGKVCMVTRLSFLEMESSERSKESNLDTVIDIVCRIASGSSNVLCGCRMGPLSEAGPSRGFLNMNGLRGSVLEFYNSNFQPNPHDVNLPVW